MKQIIQDLKDGKTILEDVPVPQIKSGYVLVKIDPSQEFGITKAVGNGPYADRQ